MYFVGNFLHYFYLVSLMLEVTFATACSYFGQSDGWQVCALPVSQFHDHQF